MDERLEHLQGLGYRVELSQEGGERFVDPDSGVTLAKDDDRAQRVELPDVYFVEGFGVATFVPETDGDALDALVDADAHADRVFQQDEPEAAAARNRLRAFGFEVERVRGGRFRIAGDGVDRKVDAGALPAAADELLPEQQ